jgi:hypothetical protein
MSIQDNLTHICLRCKTKQPQPDNPFGWCKVCTSKDVICLTSIKANSNFRLNSNSSIKRQPVLVITRENGNVLISDQSGYLLDAEQIKDVLEKALLFAKSAGDSLRAYNIDNCIACYQEDGKYSAKPIEENGFNYLGYNPHLKLYKIGMSINPKNRVKNIRGGTELLHQFFTDNMRYSEKRLLYACNKQRSKSMMYNGNCEWFNLNQEQIDYIKTITGFKEGKFYFKGENNEGL